MTWDILILCFCASFLNKECQKGKKKKFKKEEEKKERDTRSRPLTSAQGQSSGRCTLQIQGCLPAAEGVPRLLQGFWHVWSESLSFERHFSFYMNTATLISPDPPNLEE